ncbi:MAG: 30S ribosomal protein S3 [Chloroflexi bacterium]|nr:30S ribosomal protein S3 [Chloroflexota bacterium]
MGHKVHPIGFRLGVIKDWQAHWYAGKATQYRGLLVEDIKLRQHIAGRYPEAGISRVEIERQAHDVLVTIHTARPGIVIGRGGQRVEELRGELERVAGKRVRLNIQEIRQPEIDAYLVAKNVAEQMERRISYRRAMKQAVARAQQSGAKGAKIICSGRLAGAEIARRAKEFWGQVPLHTLRANIDFNIAEAHTTLGRIGVKVWIYLGDVMPEAKKSEAEAQPPAEAKIEAPKAVEGATAPAKTAEEAKTDVATQASQVPQGA